MVVHIAIKQESAQRDAYFLQSVAARAYGLQSYSPHAFLCSVFFRIFYVIIFYNVIVHTLFTNAPVYVAEKTNFPVLLALN